MEEINNTDNVGKHRKQEDVCSETDNLSPAEEANSSKPDPTESEIPLRVNHSDNSHPRVTTFEQGNNIPFEEIEMAKADDNYVMNSSGLKTRTREIEEHDQDIVRSETKVQVLLITKSNPSEESKCNPASAVKQENEAAVKKEESIPSSSFHVSSICNPEVSFENSIKQNEHATSIPKNNSSSIDSMSHNHARTPTSKQKQRKKASEEATTGRWTAEEHREFLRGLQIHGREWKKVATLIPTRSSAQVRSHAQKYFVRLQRMRDEDQEQNGELKSIGSRDECRSTCSSTLQHSIHMEDVPISSMPLSVRLQAERILSQPETVQAEVNSTLERLRVRYRQLQEQLRQRQQAATQSSQLPTVEAAHDNESVGGGSVESLHHGELIALHVLQGGLASANESENDCDSETMATTTKMSESLDPNIDFQATKRRRLD